MSGEVSRRELLVAGAAAGLAGALAPGAFASSSPSPWLQRSAHAGRVGSSYDAGGVALRLVSVDGAAEDAFALRFTGPPGVVAGTHDVAHPALGRFALFLGPVGPAGAAQDYELVVDRSERVGAAPVALGDADGGGPPPAGAPGRGDEPAAGAAPSDGNGGRSDSAPPVPDAGGAREAPAAGRPRRAPLVRSADAGLRGGVLTADVRVAPGRGLTAVRVRLLHGDVVVATGARRLRGRPAVRLPLRRRRAIPRGELWLEVTVTGRSTATTRRRVSVR